MQLAMLERYPLRHGRVKTYHRELRYGLETCEQCRKAWTEACRERTRRRQEREAAAEATAAAVASERAGQSAGEQTAGGAEDE